MRTVKVGLLVVMLTCAVGACASGDDGFGGLGVNKTQSASGPSPSGEESSTARATDDTSPTPTAGRPTTTRPRTSAPGTPTSAGTSASGGGDWSSSYSTSFLNGCLSTSNNNTRYCQCTLTELQGKYSQAQMSAFDQEYARTNKLPDELQSTVQKCLGTG